MFRLLKVKHDVKSCHTRVGLANLWPVTAAARRTLLSVVVLTLGLAGCGQPDPQLAGGNQSDNRVIPTPTVIPQPVKPFEANEHTERGAQQFVLYWFKTINYAVQTGDVKPFQAASNPQCAPCQAVVAEVRDNYGDGGYTEGGVYTVRSSEAQNLALADQPTISVAFDRSAQSELAPDGQVRGSKPALTFRDCQVLLVKVGESWQVRTTFGDSLVE